MKRFRFTLLAVCLFLLWLGWTDVDIYLRNSSPASLSIEQLFQTGAPREWLQVKGGYQDLDRAISTSGSAELDVLLIPLLASPGQEQIRVLVETRNERAMELFKSFHFKTDSVFEKEAFRTEHLEEFQAQRDITGMVITGMIASGNRDKLLTLAKQTDLNVSEDVIFLSEGKEPERLRGGFFLGTGLLGLAGLIWRLKKGKQAPPARTGA